MKVKSILFMLISALFLVACQSDDSTAIDESVDDIKALVHEYSVGNIDDEVASITGTELIVTPEDGNEVTYSLPEDEFFVSIAPYINQTHPCTYHNLTGCQSELIEEELDVYIEDSEGNAVLDEKVTTLANGFFDLWLPRDETYQIMIQYQDMEVEAEISTFEEDATCITTMQLT
ncbi:CueP family metal-binding protein [Amphibacillus sp. Q70]|uniref:CueP family metal-binding protein n=1 Tax=Amphibacillus sp. Q70 TaxID=3453416 RepID=UPI003F82ABEA